MHLQSNELIAMEKPSISTEQSEKGPERLLFYEDFLKKQQNFLSLF